MDIYTTFADLALKSTHALKGGAPSSCYGISEIAYSCLKGILIRVIFKFTVNHPI